MTAEEIKTIRDLQQRGLGYKKIATLTGVPVNSVKTYCRRHKVDAPPAEEPQAFFYLICHCHFSCPYCLLIRGSSASRRQSPVCTAQTPVECASGTAIEMRSSTKRSTRLPAHIVAGSFRASVIPTANTAHGSAWPTPDGKAVADG